MDDRNYFIIEGRLPSLNDYVNANRSHWSRGALLKKQVEEGIMWQINSARATGKLHRTTEPSIITFEWHESDKRRDLDNIFSAKKYILDAMQKAGIIVNDNRRYIRGLEDTIYDDDRDFVQVTIYPISQS